MDRGQGIQPFPRGGGYFAEHMGRGDGWPTSLLWVIFALVLVLLLLAIVSLALDAYYRSQRPRHFMKRLPLGMPPGFFPGGRALAVVGMRYARGEISREDYLRAREDLGGPPGDFADEPTDVMFSADPPEAAVPEDESKPKPSTI
jgi:uncharacterized membrane protein